ncbi:SIR2 family protein [Xanthobacter sp. V13C-7B]|uniref:SIR2 family protein n=1 Tax=Xanthobacter variabilis TaxID=3119932 RepID=UPI00372A0F4D
MVLLGAGAAIDFGAPSTKELTDIIQKAVIEDRVMQMTGGDGAFKKIKAGLAGYLDKPGIVHFEQIYHCAHELLFTTPPTMGAYDEFKPIMQPFLADKTGLKKEALRALCEKIVEVIYHKVAARSAAPTWDLRPLADFVNSLRVDHVTRVYTTNYDDFPLQAVSDLYTGYGSTIRDGARRFDIDTFWEQQERAALFHLHGSVHMGFSHPPGYEIGELSWFDDRAEALKHAFFSGSSPSRMDGTYTLRTSVVTGLEKLSRVQARPLSHYYSALTIDAMRADIIYVIGSGLADLHLNTWLAEARARSPKPPLLFVDYNLGTLKDGVYFPNDRKVIELFHRLQVHVNGSMRGNMAGDWLVTQDRTAAVWHRGFRAFLEEPEQHARVLSLITRAGKAP